MVFGCTKGSNVERLITEFRKRRSLGQHDNSRAFFPRRYHFRETLVGVHVQRRIRFIKEDDRRIAVERGD